MPQDYRRERMMLLLTILCILLVSHTASGDLSYYTLLLPWSDLSWEATRKSDLFEVSLNAEETNNAIWVKDLYMGSLFGQCPNPPSNSQQFNKILKEMTDLDLFSKSISYGLMFVLLDRSFDEELNSTIDDGHKTDRILRQFVYTKHPLKKLKEIISSHSTNGTVFVKKYLEYQKLCKSVTSQLQNIDILLRFIRWISVKIYGTVIAAQALYQRLGYDEERFKVLSEALYEFRIDAEREVHDVILDFSRENSKNISSAVYTRDVPGKPKEVAMFKRIFVERWFDIQVSHSFSGDAITECSRINKAPQKCGSPPTVGVCGVGFPCDKTSCQALQEPVIICLDRADRTKNYDYYMRRGDLYPRGCEHFHHFKPKEELFPETNKKFELAAVPCECLCQEEEDNYYYYTKPALANVADHKVVTGAKLDLVDKTLVIRIQQGELRIDGTIDPATREWLTPDIDSSDRDITEKISLSETNAIDLTRFQVPYGQVVTGLSLFKGYGNNNGSDHRIKLRVHSHGYDYESGKLIGEPGQFDTPTARSEVNLTESVSASVKESLVRRKFIRFTVSGGQDGGKRTFPLIDSRKLILDVPTPLSGAGFYVRKSWDEVTLGIELLTYNWTVPKQNGTHAIP